MNFIVKNSTIYQRLFLYLAKERIEKQDANLNQIHVHIISTLSTGLLMWAYAFVAYFFMDVKTAGIVGFVCSIIHNLTLLFFKFSKNVFVICQIMLLAGVVHQGSFAIHHGGFESFILIWFAVIPLLGGVIAGKRSLLFQFVIVTFVATVFLLLFVNGYKFENHLSSQGEIISLALIIFGFIFLSSLLVLSIIVLKEFNESLRREEKKCSDSLFKVLIHDFQNPLYILRNYIKKIKRFSDDENFQKNLDKIEKAQHVLIQISESMKRMHDVEKEKIQLKRSHVSLLDSLQYIEGVVADSLRIKKLSMKYDINAFKERIIYVDESIFRNQVLANIISNAIKFSNKGSRIEFSCYDTNDSFNLVVKDYGVGIPKDILNTIYDGGKEISRTGTLGEVGAGFGLAIARTFMRSFDGDIIIRSRTIEDSPDHGTKITLVFFKNYSLKM